MDDWEKLMTERRRVIRNLINLDLELKQVLKERLCVVEQKIDEQEMSEDDDIDFYVDEETRKEMIGAECLLRLKV